MPAPSPRANFTPTQAQTQRSPEATPINQPQASTFNVPASYTQPPISNQQPNQQTPQAPAQQGTATPLVQNSPSPSDVQFKADIGQATYQHSLAENLLTNARQRGGQKERTDASTALARSLDYDISAVNRRLADGGLSPDRYNQFQAEATRLKSEQDRQLVTADRDDFAYASAISEANFAIGKMQLGQNADRETRNYKDAFAEIDAHNDQAVSAVRDAEAKLQELAIK